VAFWSPNENIETFQLIQHKNVRKIKYIWTMFLANLNQYKSKEQYQFIILESLLHSILKVRLDWHSSQVHSLPFFHLRFFWLLSISFSFQLTIPQHFYKLQQRWVLFATKSSVMVHLFFTDFDVSLQRHQKHLKMSVQK